MRFLWGEGDFCEQKSPFPPPSFLVHDAIAQALEALVAEVTAQEALWGSAQVHHQEGVEGAEGGILVESDNASAQLQVVFEEDGQVAAVFHVPDKGIDVGIGHLAHKGGIHGGPPGFAPAHQGCQGRVPQWLRRR